MKKNAIIAAMGAAFAVTGVQASTEQLILPVLFPLRRVPLLLVVLPHLLLQR
jgi:hypothetical protein